jgi:molybdate transport system ATP-binding protein
MTLSVRIRHRLGDFVLDAAFESSGRLTALFGPSGSGKTSLVNMIGGLIRPREGRIAADGRVLVDIEARLFVPQHRRRIGYVFQDARLFPHLNVRQNLDYGRRMNRLPDDPAQHKRVTDLLDIGPLLDRRPGKLSGGERQRVAIARALANEPRLLLADEPTGALDSATGEQIVALLQSVRGQRGTTVLLVTNDPDVAARADRILRIRDGRIEEATRAAAPRSASG